MKREMQGGEKGWVEGSAFHVKPSIQNIISPKSLQADCEAIQKENSFLQTALIGKYKINGWFLWLKLMASSYLVISPIGEKNDPSDLPLSVQQMGPS